MDEDFRDHYATGVEAGRVESGPSSIEFERTREILERFLPPPPARILDVGGGPGAYATWLAGVGFDVHLIDPVQLHVDQANERARRLGLAFTAALGDARSIDEAAASCDAVLLLGPLYHLTERSDRVAALAEARRVVRPDGIVAAAAVSRFASLFDGLVHGFLDDPAFADIVERDLRDGQHRNPTGNPSWFTTAYFHLPDELPVEFADAGLAIEAVFGLEGLAHLVPEVLERPRGREELLWAARAIESEPSLMGLSDHLLAVGRRIAR